MRAALLKGLLGLLLALPVAARAESFEPDDCAAHFAESEAVSGIPAGLLASISLVESGHGPFAAASARSGWPWTINVEGEGHFFATRAEAVAEVRRLLASGRRSIDVGCMQVNLMYHPLAFASLEEAFDPAHNVAYGARFLRGLKDQSGSWDEAIARYHSAEPLEGADYRRKVLAAWHSPPAAAFAYAATLVVHEADLRAPDGWQRAWQLQRQTMAKLIAAGKPRRLARLVIIGG